MPKRPLRCRSTRGKLGQSLPPCLNSSRSLQAQSYRYQPTDVVVQQHYQVQQMQAAPVPYAQGNPSKQEQKQAKQVQKQVKQVQKQAAKQDQKQAKQHDGPKGDKPEKLK